MCCHGHACLGFVGLRVGENHEVTIGGIDAANTKRGKV